MKRFRTFLYPGTDITRPGPGGKTAGQTSHGFSREPAAQAGTGNSVLANSRGTALLLTLAIITLVLAVTLEINRQVRASVNKTFAYTNREHLMQIASSGINAAQAILIRDRYESDTDSLVEDWADPQKVAQVLDDIPFDRGKVSVAITDELGRIQVNALVTYPARRDFNEAQRVIWEQFFQSVLSREEQFEDISPDAIINLAKDWLDTGDDGAITGLSGAESDYYQGLAVPYACKNGPFAHLNELALLKDFPQDLLRGSAAAPGLAAYLTVWGAVDLGGGVYDYPGRINLNTADPAVVAAVLPWEYKDLAPAVVDYRQTLIESDNREAFQDALWYRQAPGCSELEIVPEIITNASDLFRIESRAVLDEAQLTIVALVRRENQEKTGKWICKTLQWETE
jgi:general secretion pathway protein K